MTSFFASMVWWHFMSRWKICIVLCKLSGFFFEVISVKRYSLDKYLFLLEEGSCWLHFCTTVGSAGLLHMCKGRFESLQPTGWKRWRPQERMFFFNLLCATGHQNVPVPALFPYKQLSLLLWDCCMICSIWMCYPYIHTQWEMTPQNLNYLIAS